LRETLRLKQYDLDIIVMLKKNCIQKDPQILRISLLQLLEKDFSDHPEHTGV